MPFGGNGRSIPELFTDVVMQLTTLLRKEGQLARTEISENIGKMAVGLGIIVGGAVLMIPALVILLEAAVTGLAAQGMATGWAALLVGGVALLLGLAMLFVGAKRLKAETIVPSKTIQQLQQDVSVAKEQVRYTDEHRAA